MLKENFKKYIEIYNHLNENQKKLLVKESYNDLIKYYGDTRALDMCLSAFIIATNFHERIDFEERAIFYELFYREVDKNAISDFDLESIKIAVNDPNHDAGLMFLDLVMSFAVIDEEVEDELIELLQRYYEDFITDEDLASRIEEDQQREIFESSLSEIEDKTFKNRYDLMN